MINTNKTIIDATSNWAPEPIANLIEKYYTYETFSYEEFEYGRLDGKIHHNALFDNCDFYIKDDDDSICEEGCKCPGCYSPTNPINVDFTSSTFIFEGGDELINNTFKNCNFTNCTFIDVNLINATFKQCDFTNVTFVNVNFGWNAVWKDTTNFSITATLTKDAKDEKYCYGTSFPQELNNSTCNGILMSETRKGYWIRKKEPEQSWFCI